MNSKVDQIIASIYAPLTNKNLANFKVFKMLARNLKSCHFGIENTDYLKMFKPKPVAVYVFSSGLCG